MGAQNVSELNKILNSCAFRARRGDWMEKLDSDYEIVHAGLSKGQEEAYRTMEHQMLVDLDSDMITVEMAISKVMKLQQICSGFILDDGKTFPITDFVKTPKFKDLKERLDQMIIGKTIIVAHYQRTVRELYGALSPYTPALISGSAQMGDRGLTTTEEVRKFNEDPDCKVLVAQGQACLLYTSPSPRDS